MLCSWCINCGLSDIHTHRPKHWIQLSWPTGANEKFGANVQGYDYIVVIMLVLQTYHHQIFFYYGHLCHRRIGVYKKHPVSDGKNLVNADYELN